MKRLSLILSAIVFSLVFVVLPKAATLAQMPSFEIYKSSCSTGVHDCPTNPANCTPYPSVDCVNVYKYQNSIVVTARVYDVSGSLYGGVVANVEDPSNHTCPGNPGGFCYMNVEYQNDGSGIMYDDGTHDDGAANDGIYGAIFDVSDTSTWDYNANYQVDIAATDNLLNQSGSAYNNAKSFTISNAAATSIVNFTYSGYPTPPTAGAAIKISASLKYTNGPFIGGETITFTDGTNTYTATTGDGTNGTTLGVAIISYYIPFSASTITLYANYSGNSSLGTSAAAQVQLGPFSLTPCGTVANNSAGTAIVCVASTTPTDISSSTSSQSINTFTIAGSTSPTINIGAAATIAVQLSSAVSGETITFLDTSTGNQLIAPQTTNSSGAVSFTTYKQSFTGAHTIEAIFAGDVTNNLNPSIQVVTVTGSGTCAVNSTNNASVCITTGYPIDVSSSTSSQSISTFTIAGSTSPTINIGAAATIAVQLSSAVAGETINFLDTTTGNQLIAPQTTNSSGAVSFTTYTQSFTGAHTIEAIFAGDVTNNLKPSIKTVTVTGNGTCAVNSSNNASVCITTGYPIDISSSTSSQSISTFTIAGSTSPTINIGAAATIAVQLSSAVSGETINFLDTTTGNQLIAPQTTNSSGAVNFTTYAQSFTGAHIIEAIFAGDVANNLNPSIQVVTVTGSGTCAVNSTNNASVCITTGYPIDISSSTSTQSMTSVSASKVSTTGTVTAVFTSTASGDTVYFIDVTAGTAIGSQTITSGSASLSFSISSWTVGSPHTLEAIYAGNMLKSLTPSVRTTTLTK